MEGIRVTEEDVHLSEALATFIQRSPSQYHAVQQIRMRLDQAGFSHLPETAAWDVEPGGRYYTTRNDSSIIAFTVGAELGELRFQVSAAHSDSPTFKVKACPYLTGPGPYLRLGTEPYGGVIDRSWLDRPLSLAGRVMVRDEGRIESRLVYLDRDVLVIPSLAIHLDREVNKKGSIDRRTDMMPLVSSGAVGAGSVEEAVAEAVGTSAQNIVAFDLYLANRQVPTVWGLGREFISAPRLDDLQCAFASLIAFLGSYNERTVAVYACFDNEEVGSATMQGACSTFLSDVLERASRSLGYDAEEHRRGIARSMLMSCDNAQGVHPNHQELYDEANRAWLNRGVVVKETASQRYVTDSLSRAFFLEVCRRAGVPTQTFANRSDMPGGSTLGNLLTGNVSMHGVDIGLAQLAMHASYETAGVCDTAHMVSALGAFFAADYTVDKTGAIEFD